MSRIPSSSSLAKPLQASLAKNSPTRAAPLDLTTPGKLPPDAPHIRLISPLNLPEGFFGHRAMLRGKPAPAFFCKAFNLIPRSVRTDTLMQRAPYMPQPPDPETHKASWFRNNDPAKVVALLNLKSKKRLGKSAVTRNTASKRITAAIKWCVQREGWYRGATAQDGVLLCATPLPDAIETPMADLIASARQGLKKIGIRQQHTSAEEDSQSHSHPAAPAATATAERKHRAPTDRPSSRRLKVQNLVAGPSSPRRFTASSAKAVADFDASSAPSRPFSSALPRHGTAFRQARARPPKPGQEIDNCVLLRGLPSTTVPSDVLRMLDQETMPDWASYAQGRNTPVPRHLDLSRAIYEARPAYDSKTLHQLPFYMLRLVQKEKVEMVAHHLNGKLISGAQLSAEVPTAARLQRLYTLSIERLFTDTGKTERDYQCRARDYESISALVHRIITQTPGRCVLMRGLPPSVTPARLHARLSKRYKLIDPERSRIRSWNDAERKWEPLAIDAVVQVFPSSYSSAERGFFLVRLATAAEAQRLYRRFHQQKWERKLGALESRVDVYGRVYRPAFTSDLEADAESKGSRGAQSARFDDAWGYDDAEAETYYGEGEGGGELDGLRSASRSRSAPTAEELARLADPLAQERRRVQGEEAGQIELREGEIGEVNVVRDIEVQIMW